MIPFPDMAAALKAGHVDAISAVEPFITGAEQAMGAVPVMSQCTGSLSRLPLSGYFATAAWVAKYPHTAHAFQAAMQKAQAFADANPAAVPAGAGSGRRAGKAGRAGRSRGAGRG